MALVVSACGSDAPTLAPPVDEVTGRPPQESGNYLEVSSFPIEDLIPILDPDDVPALTDPRMVGTADPTARYLYETDLVLGVVMNGEARAYPHNIGWWHEIINDVVGGIPVCVTFCPLTGTGLVFDARGEDGSRVRLGVSGMLFSNNLVMYDRRDEGSPRTLYPQMTHRGVTGPREGQELALLPVVETTWRFWKQLHPDTKVVSGLTDFLSVGNYTVYPYGPGTGRATDYREVHDDIYFTNTPPLTANPAAALFRNKDTVLGIRFGELAVAYPFPSMGEMAAVNDEVAGNPVVVVHYAAEHYAVPFFRTVGGTTLTFDIVETGEDGVPFYLRDRESGSRWNLKGEAVEGRYRGFKLRQVPAHNAYWFAWATFWRNTGIL